jgi:hypothetical protein
LVTSNPLLGYENPSRSSLFYGYDLFREHFCKLPFSPPLSGCRFSQNEPSADHCVTAVTVALLALNLPSNMPFTRTEYDPEVKLPRGTVTENGFNTVMQATPALYRLYTWMLMLLLVDDDPTTTRNTWHGSGKFPLSTAATLVGEPVETINRLPARSRKTLSRMSRVSPGWGE